jgi:hypothetical protein
LKQRASARVRPQDGTVEAVVRTLELAISKAAELPEATQEQLGRELLERIESLIALRADIEIGVREFEAGQGRELDIKEHSSS